MCWSRSRALVSIPWQGFTLFWPHLGAVEALVGYASDGSPLRAVLANASRGQAEAMTNLLARNVGLGVNPRVTARQMRAQFEVTRTRALTIARTESLRAYRAAAQMTMQENADVLDGWVWVSAMDRRTCVGCMAMHGSVHPLTETLEEHPAGRCMAAPRVKGSKQRIATGSERFAALSAERQRVALGPAAYEAYRDGALRLEDLVGRTHSERWGDSIRVRSLREVLGVEGAAGYVERGRVRTEVLAGLAQTPTTPKALAQVDRLVEVRAMPAAEVSGLLERIRQERTLPKLEQHWQRHSDKFVGLGVEDAAGYAELLRDHLRRPDLRLFTYVTTKSTRDRMWIAVGMDNGLVAQYNETKRRFWSFYRQEGISQYAADSRGWWVAVIESEAGIQFEPWQ